MDSAKTGKEKVPPPHDEDDGLVFKLKNPNSAQKLASLNSKMPLREGDRKKAAQSLSAQMVMDWAETPEHLSMNVVKQQYLHDPTLPAADKALFVQEAAEHACKSARPGEEHSPSTINLFQRFKDLGSKKYSTAGMGNQLKRAVAHSYVNAKNGHRRHSMYTPTDLFPKLAGTNHPTGVKSPNPPMAPTTSDSHEEVAVPPPNPVPNPPPNNRAPELAVEAPLESTSRYTNWESIDNIQTFPDLHLASEFMDNQPFMHFLRTQKNVRARLSSDRSVAKQKFESVRDYSCKLLNHKCGSCKARIYTLGNTFTLKLNLHPQTCACQRGEGLERRNGLPYRARYYASQSLNKSPAPKPEMIVSTVIESMRSHSTRWSTYLEGTAERNLIGRQIITFVGNARSRGRRNGILLPRADTVHNLMTTKKGSVFNLPSPQDPEFLELFMQDYATESDLGVLASKLYDTDHLSVMTSGVLEQNGLSPTSEDGKNLVRLQAYRFATILDGRRDPDEPEAMLSNAEIRLYKRINELMRDPSRNGESAWEKSTVMSSLGLLWNIRKCADIDFQCCVSSDGADGMISNEFKLLNVGTFTIHHTNSKMERSFRPFAFAITPQESELYFSILLVTILKYTRRIFRLSDMNFAMCISDHAPAFVRPYATAFDRTLKAQCYPHIRRKFGTGTGELSEYSAMMHAVHFVSSATYIPVSFSSLWDRQWAVQNQLPIECRIHRRDGSS